MLHRTQRNPCLRAAYFTCSPRIIFGSKDPLPEHGVNRKNPLEAQEVLLTCLLTARLALISLSELALRDLNLFHDRVVRLVADELVDHVTSAVEEHHGRQCASTVLLLQIRVMVCVHFSENEVSTDCLLERFLTENFSL